MLVDDARIVEMYEAHLQTLKRSQTTIADRIRGLQRLQIFLDGRSVLNATPADLRCWQETFRHLSANTVRVYTAHLQQFYRWAIDFELLEVDPSRRLTRPRIGRGVSRPVFDRELEYLFAICDGEMRAAFVLAAFAGLGAGEIARSQHTDISRGESASFLLVRGKGNKRRRVPLIPLVLEELDDAGIGQCPGPLFRTGIGSAYTPNHMSKTCNRYLHEIVRTNSTLHSLRHWYLANVHRITGDPVFVRDLVGRVDSAAPSDYMRSGGFDETGRLAGYLTENVAVRRHLYAVPDLR